MNTLDHLQALKSSVSELLVQVEKNALDTFTKYLLYGKI